MFEENDNIYPVKPKLLTGTQGRNRMGMLVFGLVLLFFSTTYFSDAYLLLLELLIVLVIHELGHFLMMRKFGAKAQGMFFMSFLGNSMKDLKSCNSQKQQALINIMGPLPGVLIGCGLYVYALYSEPNLFLFELGLLFIGVNLVNLMPIDPFDGGRIIEAFYFSGDDQRKMVFTLVSSVLMIAVGVFISFLPLIIFGFLMGLKVRSYQKSKELHVQLDETNVDYKKEYKDLTNREYWKIRSAFLTNNPKIKEMIPSGYTLWENEKLLMEQVRQILRTNIKPDISFLGKISIILLMLFLITIPVLLILSNYEMIDWYLENANF